MSLTARNYRYRWVLRDGRTVTLRPARKEDVGALRSLYTATYGEHYSLPEVIDDRKTHKVLSDPEWYWLMAEHEGKAVASLLFGLEKGHRLGKTFGGVVHPQYRGHKIMKTMLKQGLHNLLGPHGPFDLVYAVVRTFVSLSFHQDLASLGFIDVGVFPNVRKVKQYETHGLKVCLSRQALQKRLRRPVLIPQIHTLYQIVRKKMDLEPAHIDPHRNTTPLGEEPRIQLNPVDLPIDEIEKIRKHTASLRFRFFPLHEPNRMLTDADGRAKVFLYIQPKDRHASILGLTTGGFDLAVLLASVADYCESSGAAYLELLVPAYAPDIQSQAYRAGFLPCAYFPAASLDQQGYRRDLIITSKTFVPLHFSGLKLTEDTKPFLLEYYKIYTARLWEELMNA